MKGLAGVAFFIFFVTASVDLGSATKCYVCIATKGEGKDCEKHVEKETSLECVDPTDYCLTVIAKDVLTRSCSPKNGCDAFKGVSSFCKVCHSDLCNTDSGSFVPSYSTSLVATLAFFSLMKLFM